MSSSVAVDSEMSALKKELGTVGTAYFIRQFDTGHGDYTLERDELFEGISIDELIKEIQQIDTVNE